MGAEDIIFYSVFITLGVGFVFITFGMGTWVGAGYGVFLLATLLFIFAVEQRATMVLGFTPEQNLRFTYVYGLIYLSYGFVLAYLAAAGQQTRKWTRPLLAIVLAVCAVTMVRVLPPFNAQPAKFLDTLLLLMLASHLAAGFTWRTSEGRINRVALSALLVGTLSVAGIYFALFFTTWDGKDEIYILRVPYAIVAFLTVGTMTYGLIDMRRAHARALQDKLLLAQKQAAQSVELLRLERAYSQAQADVLEHTRRLSDVSHDLRQPIASIRAEIDAAALPDEPRDRLRKLADHLYEMSDLYVGGRAQELPTKDEVNPLAEVIDLRVFFSTVKLLLSSDAEAAGTTLRVVDSRSRIFAPATPLMRIVSNLVTNAVNHAGASRILVGAKRAGDRVRIIVADDGSGLTPDELEQAFRRGTKDDASEGSGLGLPIVRLLTEQFGIELETRAQKGKGLMFALAVPYQEEG